MAPQNFSGTYTDCIYILYHTYTHVRYIIARLRPLHFVQRRWHVGIIGNEKADNAAKAGLSKRVANVSLPYGDFRKHIYVLLKHKWQSQWDEAANNKLHEIHPQLGLWSGVSRIIRREESVLARIRIGHIYLTHCFLLKGEDPPQCIAIDCQLTVKHILFDCVDFIESRNRHFNVDIFKELFEKVPPDSIISYVHDCLKAHRDTKAIYCHNICAKQWSVLPIVKPFKNL